MAVGGTDHVGATHYFFESSPHPVALNRTPLFLGYSKTKAGLMNWRDFSLLCHLQAEAARMKFTAFCDMQKLRTLLEASRDSYRHGRHDGVA